MYKENFDKLFIGTIDKLKFGKDFEYDILFTFCPCCNEEIIIYRIIQ